MSQLTVASIPRLAPSTLSALLLDSPSSVESPPASPTNFAIIDVRDDDHVGGHIKHSLHRPSLALAMEPTAAGAVSPMRKLVLELRGKPIVVFHCALSQVRGPSMALRYTREQEAMREAQRKRRLLRRQGALDEAESWEHVSDDEDQNSFEQRIYVLDRGFVGWQEVYGEDPRLTEGFRKELWR